MPKNTDLKSLRSITTMRLFVCHLILLGLSTLLGCSSSPSPIPIPGVDSNAAEAAIKQFDSNGDQAIDEEELKKSPGLRAAMARLDRDKNRKVTADEINGRIEAWKSSRVGMTSCTVIVHQNGKPLENAQVKMIPEGFLGQEIKSAQGVTNIRGMAPVFLIDEPDLAGAHLGFYRVEISKMVDGKETIPSRYNTQSELGMELASDVFDSHHPIFDLQNR